MYRVEKKNRSNYELSIIKKLPLFPCVLSQPIGVNYRRFPTSSFVARNLLQQCGLNCDIVYLPDSRDSRSKTISEISTNAGYAPIALCPPFVRIISIIRAWPMSLFTKVIVVERVKAVRQDDSHAEFAESRSDRFPGARLRQRRIIDFGGSGKRRFFGAHAIPATVSSSPYFPS